MLSYCHHSFRFSTLLLFTSSSFSSSPFLSFYFSPLFSITLSLLFPSPHIFFSSLTQVFHRAAKIGSLVNPQLDDFRKIMFNPMMYTTWVRTLRLCYVVWFYFILLDLIYIHRWIMNFEKIVVIFMIVIIISTIITIIIKVIKMLSII